MNAKIESIERFLGRNIVNHNRDDIYGLRRSFATSLIEEDIDMGVGLYKSCWGTIEIKTTVNLSFYHKLFPVAARCRCDDELASTFHFPNEKYWWLCGLQLPVSHPDLYFRLLLHR